MHRFSFGKVSSLYAVDAQTVVATTAQDAPGWGAGLFGALSGALFPQIESTKKHTAVQQNTTQV